MYSLLRNAGFDDNPPGNMVILTNSLDMPAWTWAGGTNAGYISRSFKYNEEQSLAITYANNLAQQSFPVSISAGNLLLNPGFELGAGGGAEPTSWFRYGDGGQVE